MKFGVRPSRRVKWSKKPRMNADKTDLKKANSKPGSLLFVLLIRANPCLSAADLKLCLDRRLRHDGNSFIVFAGEVRGPNADESVVVSDIGSACRPVWSAR